MSNNTILPDTTVGTGQPTFGRVLLTLILVGIIGLFALFTNVFGWDSMPIIGDIVPLVGNLGGSGIWYYLIGFFIGIGIIVATFIGEVVVE
ncbi:MAG: hypothetical protein CBE08_001680 [Euryarchaeota archaeon TMED248]|nr:hypothetical protein [Euryarchaeota archaeon]RPG76865.1 MAG: hypothetical protein CBE08_001680 [Euryarchaeota archaeon TMED248]|tara:strand:+ start:6914 stop:7186 length:273 start_codon:yes stop_codon:yes gene_type:complete